MIKVFNWERASWSGSYSIFGKGDKKGQLKFSSFLDKATGIFNGISCTFKSGGFIRYSTKIVDTNTGKEIGEIGYNLSMSKATISLNGIKYDCIAKDSLTNKSKKFFNKDEEVNLKGSSSKGIIETNTDNDLLIFSTFFATQFCWQMVSVSLIAAFVPIFAVLLGIIA